MSKEAIEHYEAALKEAFPSGATGDVFHHWNEARKALAEQPAQQALDKMAENARELGLDYEPRAWFTVDELNAWADKKLEENPHWNEAPEKQDIPDLIAGALGVSRGTAYDLMREALAEQPAQQQEPKLPEFYARFEDGLVSVYQRREDATPLLLLRENLPDKQPAQQPNEADDLIRNLGFDPEQFRTEAGFINHMKLRAAIQHPEEYRAAMQPMYQKLTNCVLCGRLNPKEGVCDHGVEQPAQQQEPVAWGNFKEDGTLVGLSQHPEDQANWTGRKPLYASPQAQRTPAEVLDWLADQHRAQCGEDRPIQEWIRKMKGMLP